MKSGKITAGLIFFIIITFSLYLLTKIKPYKRKSFYNLELISLLITLFTVYFGILFISDAS